MDANLVGRGAETPLGRRERRINRERAHRTQREESELGRASLSARAAVKKEFYPQITQMTADGEWEFPKVGKIWVQAQPAFQTLEKMDQKVPLETKSREAGAIATATERSAEATIGRWKFNSRLFVSIRGSRAVGFD